MAKDRYASFKALDAGERRGRDFDIWHADHGTAVLVLTPHGGWIEPGTSEIVRAIARDDLSAYAFEGLRAGRGHEALHIKSHLFDEPAALTLARRAETVIGIHGRGDEGDPETIMFGGLDSAFGKAIAASLAAAGFSVGPAGDGLAAQDQWNICRRRRAARAAPEPAETPHKE